MAKNFQGWGETENPEDLIHNTSNNDSFDQVLERARLGRRGFLRGVPL
jgi:hypothetical protein